MKNMRKETVFRIFAGLSFFLGVMMIFTGSAFYGFAFICLSVGVILTTSVGKNKNERDQYDKIISGAQDFDLDGLFDALAAEKNGLGGVWKARHDSVPDQCIVIGPSPFKDYIIVGKSDDKLILKGSFNTSHLRYSADEAWRFEHCVDTSEMPVTAKNYSIFAAYKLVTVMMLDDLTKYCEGIINGSDEELGRTFGEHTLFHYDSSDGIVKDIDDNEYASVETTRKPLNVTVRNTDGEQVSAVTELDKKKDVFLYDVNLYGEGYGKVRKDLKSYRDVYVCETPDGTFRLESFAAVRYANLAANYRLMLDGETKAILACNAGIRFGDSGLLTNDIIISYDDDFLLVYITLEEMLTGANAFLK